MRLTGLVYRAHHPRWTFAPDSGEGAARFGGRFNPVGVAALYTSLRLETAWLETQQGLPFKAQPMTLCAYSVACDDIADLTDPITLAALSIDSADLACPWEALADRGANPPSWAITERLRATGIAGIVVPSFAPGAVASDRNVVFWQWEATPPHRVRVIDNLGRLPRDESSWH